MPIKRTDGEKFKGIRASEKQKTQLKELCQELTDKYPQLWSKAGTIVEDTKMKMRVDRQGKLSKPFVGMNIQAQTGKESLAAIGLAETLSDGKMPEEGQRAVEEEVKAALQHSAESGKWRYVTGTYP
ncbi:hypothetical protein DDE74_12660 [Streptomyces lydicus]|uniref:Uncharacterized protein n=1 Tax=Streptomyces lydicus TaxID=47763 RepID=A0A3Q9K9J1_9ACTN|nr:hypothetical protein [Streptomyces lydicus]AZS71694.1 hypothetical protein DDE74_12660 [Streptomyces lydicus]